MACARSSSRIRTATGSKSTPAIQPETKTAREARAEFICMHRSLCCLQLAQLVFDFELFALEGSNREVIMAQMRHFVLDLPLQFPVPTLQRGDVAFSRHDNSFQLYRNDSMVTKNGAS